MWFTIDISANIDMPEADLALTVWRLVMPVLLKLVNIGSGNVLLPESTKPLPEPILTYN